MSHTGLTERLRRDSEVSTTSIEDRLRRASVQSVDSVRSDVDISGMEQDKAARLIARRVSMATITRNRREKEEEMGMAPEWTCETKNRRCRYATDHFLESDAVVGALVLMVIIETAAGESLALPANQPHTTPLFPAALRERAPQRQRLTSGCGVAWQ
jgi:hypothetical protein